MISRGGTDIYLLTISNVFLQDTKLGRWMMSAPTNAIVLEYSFLTTTERHTNTSSVTITHRFTRKCLIRASIDRLSITVLMYSWYIMIQPMYSIHAPVSRLVITIIAMGMTPARPSYREIRGANPFLFWQGQLSITSPVHNDVYGRSFVYQGLKDSGR